jgi:hypothetical protein
MMACNRSETDPKALFLLLADSRIHTDRVSSTGLTPVAWVAGFGNVKGIRWLIASGRPLVLGDSLMFGETKSLLEEFMANPDRTRHEIRKEIGILPGLITELFVVLVLVCDGFLVCGSKPGRSQSAGSSRSPGNSPWSSRRCCATQCLVLGQEVPGKDFEAMARLVLATLK